MITIYHNPRCSKSRQGVQLLDDKKIPYEMIHYLKTPFTKAQLKDVLQKLNMKPIELVRQKENIWKQEYASKELTDEQIIDILISTPQLIERPIVVHQDRAVIARPTEKIEEIL